MDPIIAEALKVTIRGIFTLMMTQGVTKEQTAKIIAEEMDKFEQNNTALLPKF